MLNPLSRPITTVFSITKQKTRTSKGNQLRFYFPAVAVAPQFIPSHVR